MSLPRPVRAVIFDMDGLLVDTETVARDAFFAAAAEHGHDVPMDVYVSMIGTQGARSREILVEHFGPSFEVEPLWESWGAQFEPRLKAGARLMDGVVELLDHLDAAGIPFAIATSSPHADVDRNFAPHGLKGRFAAILARGDYERGKPEPDAFLAAAAAMGIAPEFCLALEDSHNGVRAAAAAGMMTIMVPDLLDPTEEMRSLCVRIADSLHEVREMLTAQEAAA